VLLLTKEISGVPQLSVAVIDATSGEGVELQGKSEPGGQVITGFSESMMLEVVCVHCDECPH
jgi:hypothetical protein